MKKIPKGALSEPIPMSKPGLTPEAREAQMISLAEQLAEKQLRDGTASAQVICEYLKRGSSKARMDKEKEALELELIKAKTESLKVAQNMEALFKEAIAAFTEYKGNEDNNEEDEFYD